MITVSIYKQGGYAVDSKRVREVIKKTLVDNGMVSDTQVAVAIVSKKKMNDLAKKYLDEDKAQALQHPVLSFPVSELEGPFIFPPDGKIHLGEIVISYPHAVEESKKTGKLIDQVVCDLAEHGALHLIGIHHD